MASKTKQEILAEVNAIIQEVARPCAIAELTAWVETSPDDWAAHELLAELHAENGDIEAAVECWRRTVERREKKGYFCKAISAMLKAIALAPSRIDLIASAANLYQKLGLNKKAIWHYENIIAICESSGDLSTASIYVKAIETLDPRHPLIGPSRDATPSHSGDR